MAAPEFIGSDGVVLARARGLEIVADRTYILSLVALTAFVGIPVATRALPERGIATLLIAILVAVMCSACIVLHELAHTVVARVLGHRVRRITLFSLGGVSHVEGRAIAPGAEYLVALAGPLMSLFIGAPLMLAGRIAEGPAVQAGLVAAGLVNFFLGAFNLIPAFPMDGGRILRSALWAALHDRSRATRVAAVIGRGFAVGVIGLGVASIFASLRSSDGSLLNGAWQVLLGTFLYSAAGDEARAEQDAAPTDEDVAERPDEDPDEPSDPVAAETGATT